MPNLKRSKPKTFTDRVRVAGGAAEDVAKAVENLANATGDVAGEAARTIRDRAVSTSSAAGSRFDSTRARALAAAGAAAGAAGAFAFWRSRQDSEPSINVDPAQPDRPKAVPTQTPESKAAQESQDEPAKASASANGGGSG